MLPHINLSYIDYKGQHDYKCILRGGFSVGEQGNTIRFTPNHDHILHKLKRILLINL